jgi:hypothetical protein
MRGPAKVEDAGRKKMVSVWASPEVYAVLYAITKALGIDRHTAAKNAGWRNWRRYPLGDHSGFVKALLPSPTVPDDVGVKTLKEICGI